MSTQPKTAMKTEAKKSYAYGFALPEAELRRLHDVLVQQINRTSPTSPIESLYEIRFRNGAVSSPITLDDVLIQENFGSSSIVRLRMRVSEGRELPPNVIECEFRNPDENQDSSSTSITYKVLGEDRDWVFVTSSQLDERVQKVRLFAPNQLLGRRSSFITALFGPFTLLLLLQLFLIDHKERVAFSPLFDVLERQHKSGALIDPIDATIQVGRVLANRNRTSLWKDMWPILTMVIVPLLLLGSGYTYIYFQPLYNFLWGDYVAVYERRKSRGRFVFVGVLLTIVIGVVVNFVSKKFGF